MNACQSMPVALCNANRGSRALYLDQSHPYTEFGQLNSTWSQCCVIAQHSSIHHIVPNSKRVDQTQSMALIKIPGNDT